MVPSWQFSSRLASLSGKVRTGIAIGALAFALTACQTISTPPDTYDLTAPTSFPDLRGGTNAQLLIVEPTALSAFDRQEIVVKPSATEILYLPQSQWADRLPKVVQARLVEAYENTDKARAVAKPGDGLVIDYQIVSNIRAFQANIGGGVSEAVIELSVKIVSDRTGKVVRTRIFRKTAALPSNSNSDVVLALDAAFDAIARDMVSWTFSAI